MLFLMSFRIRGIQRSGDGKDCAPLPPKEWGVRWACLAIFLLALGKPGTCLRRNRLRVPAGESSRRGQCTGAGPFFKFIACRLHVWTDIRALHHHQVPSCSRPLTSVWVTNAFVGGWRVAFVADGCTRRRRRHRRAAVGRRERRLRSWAKHERLSVAVALA